MPLVEVLGVEIRQYKGQDIKALVPRIIGQTEFARQQKKRPGKRAAKTNENDFLDACPENTRKFFARLFKESAQLGFAISWGTKGLSLRAHLPDGRLASFFYAYPSGIDQKLPPSFQAYLGEIKDQQVRELMHNSLIKHIPFVLKGEHTLQIILDHEDLANAESGLSQVLSIAKNIADGQIESFDKNVSE
jgi:hypothetical protein